MIRNILAVIGGLIVGMIVNMILVWANILIFPLPEGTDMWNPEEMKAAAQSMPAPAWILPIVAHIAQAFVGGWVAARLGASKPMMLAMIVGVLSLLGGVMNAVNLSAPAWTWIEMPLYLLAAWFAGRMEQNRRGLAK